MGIGDRNLSDQTISSASTPILIVDDNTQYATVLRRILQSVFGYRNITSVEDTQQAYDLISGDPEKFRLLFVDYNFPSGQSGGSLLEKLRDEALMNDKIAFLITSEPTPDNLKQAQGAGAIGVVAKPFDRDELRRQLEIAERAIVAENTESF